MKNFIGIIISFFVLFAVFFCFGKRARGEAEEPLSEVTVPESAVGRVLSVQYSGVRLLCSGSGEIVTLSPKEYITWALFAEMPADYPEEALKAQALCAATYAVRRRAEENIRPTESLCGADISDDFSKYPRFLTEDEAKRLYGNSYDKAFERISAAAEYAAGKAIIYENEPIIAACHAVSAGMTESALVMWGEDIPYLSSADSAFDENSPDFLSEYEFTEAEVKARLGAYYDTDIYKDIPLSELCADEKSPAGTVLSVRFGEYAVSGSDFKEIFSLPSYNYSFSFPRKNVLAVSCRGRGSGVGLSRYGAKELALRGYSCEDIVKHYFAGAEVCDICFENSAA